MSRRAGGWPFWSAAIALAFAVNLLLIFLADPFGNFWVKMLVAAVFTLLMAAGFAVHLQVEKWLERRRGRRRSG
jgi:hypothetical protein